MSVNQITCANIDDDIVKKRRLPIGRPNVSLSSSSLVKSPLKKRFKRNSIEQEFLTKSIQKQNPDNLYNSNPNTEAASIHDYKAHTPCYKKVIFPDSPVKTDPYDLPETPLRPRKLTRAKARTNLLEPCPVTTAGPSNILEKVKERSRRPPSSPHPGKDTVLCKKQEDDDAVPSVSFNSLTSSTSVTPSSTLRTPIAKDNKEALIHLKTPTSRRYIKHHGMSTSGLKGRLPVVVDLDVRPNLDVSPFNLSKLNSPLRSGKQRASISLVSLIGNEGKPTRIRRQRSSSLEMISNLSHESPGRNLRLTPERLKSLSLENRVDFSYPRNPSPLKQHSTGALVAPKNADKQEVLVAPEKNSDLAMPSTSKNCIPSSPVVTAAQSEIPYIQQTACQEENMPTTKCDDLQNDDIVLDSQETLLQTPLKSIIRSPHTEYKEQRRIKFGSLDVYYFGRAQGFEVVPKQGEIALGMGYSHFQARQFKILRTKRPRINVDDSEESELSEGEEIGVVENSFFEKTQMERIKILEAAGVPIEKLKKNNLIRQGRDQCGCSCRGGVCKPSSCECFRLGIKCQVDGPKENGSTFPCTCYNAELCSNEYGRDAYDFERVTKSRRAAIQRWKDREKTGIHAPSRLIKFYDNDDEVVADSQEPFSDPNSNVQEYQSKSSVSPYTKRNSPNTSFSFFPPSQSFL